MAAVAAFLALLALVPGSGEDEETRVFAGAFSAVDGDTLRLAAERLRLAGIDAPELGQSCGATADARDCGFIAHAYLSGVLERYALTCRGEGRDDFGRWLVRCDTGDGDLGLRIVRAGMAFASGSGGCIYAAAEARARAEGIGVWSGHVEHPQDWRRMQVARETQPSVSWGVSALRVLRNWTGLDWIEENAALHGRPDGSQLRN